MLAQLYDILAFRVVVRGDARLLPILGHRAPALAPRARPHQGLHRDAEAELLPVPPHDGDGRDEAQPFEVQIRTREMDLIAERGIAAHWKYKEGQARADTPTMPASSGCGNSWTGRATSRIPRQFLSSLKVDLYPDEVYTFTPKGEVFAFPRGATPIDFAYRVHTRRRPPVRRRARQRAPRRLADPALERRHRRDPDGAQPGAVAGLALLRRHEPRPPQDPPVHPRQEKVAGGRARPAAARAGAQEVPKDGREARGRGHARAGASRSGASRRPDDLYAAIGYGKLRRRAALERFVPAEELARPEPEQAGDRAVSRVVRKILPFGAPDIVVVGHNDLLASLAKCCTPVPGEKIVGYITRGRGVSVHSESCPNVRNLSMTPSAGSTSPGRARRGPPTRSSSRSSRTTGPVFWPT